jgi:hypothetical protein
MTNQKGQLKFCVLYRENLGVLKLVLRFPVPGIFEAFSCFLTFQTKRFTRDVNQKVVALTGKKFFYVTRGLVLSVAATIITYELVLIQFHTSNVISDYDPCNVSATVTSN